MKFIIALCSCVWLCQTLASGAAVKGNTNKFYRKQFYYKLKIFPAPNLSIVGGDPTTIQLYPWQIQIVNASTGDHLCGGSILSKFYIIR